MFDMSEEFKVEILKKMNSLSALAVEDSPINARLQKLVTRVSEIMPVSATVLFLTPDFPLSPKYLISGSDKRLIRTLRTVELQKECEEYFNPMPATDLAMGSDEVGLMRWNDNQSLRQDYEFVGVPLLAGQQKLGVLVLVTQISARLDTEKSSIFQIIAEQVALLLLLFKATQNETEQAQALRHKDLLTEEFLATLSHELRTPLHTILGWANLLQHSGTNQELRSQALKTIECSARSQNVLINELLDASYSFNKKMTLNKRPILINSILQQIIKTLRPEADRKEITLTTNIQAANDYVLADPERLRQALWHLLANAIKFTAHQGFIQLSAHGVKNAFEIKLMDSGVGISPEFLPFVFDPFRQEEFDTTRKFGGLGLGLTIVRHQIELHGGSLEIKSVGKNHGTTVVVRLPILLQSLQNNEITSVVNKTTRSFLRDSRQSLEGLRVLVMDADADSLEITSRVLLDCKAAVQVADSVGEALAILKTWQPDILISDVQMGDGFELMRRLRHEDLNLYHKITAIALMAYSQAKDRLAALATGFQTYLPKPVDPALLLAVVSSLAIRRVKSLSLT